MELLSKSNLARLAGGILLWCTAGMAFGADLQQCVNIALRQNPDILASQSQLAQAESALGQAQGQRLPKLTASVTGTRTNRSEMPLSMILGPVNLIPFPVACWLHRQTSTTPIQ
jgi:outer membrane protein TolC